MILTIKVPRQLIVTRYKLLELRCNKQGFYLSTVRETPKIRQIPKEHRNGTRTDNLSLSPRQIPQNPINTMGLDPNWLKTSSDAEEHSNRHSNFQPGSYRCLSLRGVFLGFRKRQLARQAYKLTTCSLLKGYQTARG